MEVIWGFARVSERGSGRRKRGKLRIEKWLLFLVGKKGVEGVGVSGIEQSLDLAGLEFS